MGKNVDETINEDMGLIITLNLVGPHPFRIRIYSLPDMNGNTNIVDFNGISYKVQYGPMRDVMMTAPKV